MSTHWGWRAPVSHYKYIIVHNEITSRHLINVPPLSLYLSPGLLLTTYNGGQFFPGSPPWAAVSSTDTLTMLGLVQRVSCKICVHSWWITKSSCMDRENSIAWKMTCCINTYCMYVAVSLVYTEGTSCSGSNRINLLLTVTLIWTLSTWFSFNYS